MRTRHFFLSSLEATETSEHAPSHPIGVCESVPKEGKVYGGNSARVLRAETVVVDLARRTEDGGPGDEIHRHIHTYISPRFTSSLLFYSLLFSRDKMEMAMLRVFLFGQ